MISVKNFGKKFNDQWVFRNLNFEVRTGECVVLVGPSGSGKSTLLKTLAGLFEPDEGEARIDSSEVGMLFQKNALFDSLTVEENLVFPLRERKGTPREEAVTRARVFLDAVGLKGNETLYPDEISGGMQKRLGIARALIVEPEVILYDDPTAGLDPITSKKIADLINRLRAERKSTLLAVTNDMMRAWQLGNRVFLLAEGSLHGGQAPEVIRDSQDPMIRQFIHGLREGPLTGGLE